MDISNLTKEELLILSESISDKLRAIRSEEEIINFKSNKAFILGLDDEICNFEGNDAECEVWQKSRVGSLNEDDIEVIKVKIEQTVILCYHEQFDDEDDITYSIDFKKSEINNVDSNLYGRDAYDYEHELSKFLPPLPSGYHWTERSENCYSPYNSFPHRVFPHEELKKHISSNFPNVTLVEKILL